MSLGVASPTWLALLLLVPVVLVGARRRPLAAALRGLAMAAIACAAAGLHATRAVPAGGSCVVVAVDRSASVGDGGLATAQDVLATLAPRLGPRDLVGAVTFAGDATTVALPEPGTALARTALARATPPAVDHGDTDLAAALAAATPLCPADRQAAIVLVTDGRETRGSSLAEVALSDAMPAVFPIVPPARALPPAGIRRLLVPTLLHGDGPVPLEAVVENRLDVPIVAALRLTSDGVPLAERPVSLPPGVSVAAVPTRPLPPGPHALTVTLAPLRPAVAGDVATAAVTVAAPPRIVVVSERARSVIAEVLAARGFDVVRLATVTADGLEAALAGAHAVVLDDVSHARLPDAALARLATWVARGGGLVVAGGRHTFGDPGFVTSPLARLLPVELQSQAPEPKEREPIALELVIDRSNSMGWSSRPDPSGAGEKMDYARRAALAVLDQLGPHDLVGAIAFDSRPWELGPLLPVRRGRDALAARIATLQHGGGTDFKDAMDIARDALVASARRVRHVILLTDGDSNRRADDHDDLIAALARDGVTVTTIRVGSDTVNLELLERISHETGGEFHHVADPRALPQLMIRDTRRLLDAPGNLVNAAVRLGTDGPMLAGIDPGGLPRVGRWAVARTKPDAELRLWLDARPRRDPLLVTWRWALGRVAAVPVDFQSGAAEWIGSPAFGKLWAQIVGWTMRDAVPGERHLTLEPADGGMRVRIDSPAGEPEPLAIAAAGGAPVPLTPVSATRAEALLPAMAPGDVALTLHTGGAAATLTATLPAVRPGARERRAGGADRRLLRQLAARTGGALDPSPAALLAARPGIARAAVPFATPLVLCALALVLADVALRRLR